MLATQPPLNCILGKNLLGQEIMKSGDNNNHLVYTLEDDISDQVLKSKNEEDTASGSSSVALWIKSLKENSVGFDDSKLDQDNPGYTAGGSSSSDQDDLILGAEATDLRNRQKTRKHPASLRDSDSDGSNRRYSWTGRRTFLTNRLSYDRSLDSDTSGFSSVTSVSSLLTARESDPEDVLKGLGFRGPSVLDKIPDRFIDTGTICDGVDSEQFFCSVQGDSEDAGHMNSEIPPWVMARFDEIPKKFWNQMGDPLSESTDAGQGVPLVNEPSSDETNDEISGLTRPSKVCPSKFGTYLEPVTEEAELSSQGSVTLSPMKTLSFESTRSTLKAYSQDGPSDSMAIPSLCDLWQTTEDDPEMNPEPIRIEGHGLTPNDTGSNRPGEIDQGYNGDWIDKSRDDGLYSSMPAICDIQRITAENIPAIPSGPWGSPQTDASVPALSSYFSDGNTYASDDRRDSSEVDGELSNNQCLEVTNNPLVKLNVENQCLAEVTDNVKNDISNVPDSHTLTQKHPTLNIPTVTISEPAGKSRKISTVQAPDIDLLLPVIRPTESPEDTNVPSSKSNVKNHSQGKVKAAQNKPTQLNLYASQNWAAVENKKKPQQIQFLNQGTPKCQRRLAFRSRKTADAKVTLSVSQCRQAAKQVTVPEHHFGNIPCFSDLVIECSQKTAPDLTCSETRTVTVQTSGGSESFARGERTFLPLPLRQAEIPPSAQWNSKYGESSVHCDRRKSSEAQDERLGKEIDSGGQTSSRREEYLSTGSDDSKSNRGAHLKNGLSIEEEIGGLQNSLKGVKMYKAGIHLMQLASSVETVMCSERRPNRLRVRSSERLLDSIQKELKHLEEYILRLQKQLKAVKKQSREKEETPEDVQRRGSDFSDITRQLLQEQHKMFNSISSAAVSPASTPSESVSREESLCSETPDVLRHTDVMKLRREIQQLRQDSEERNSSIKEEILGEVRAEIRNCFKEFLQTKSK